MKVLLTDASYKHTLGAARALATEGVEVHVCSSFDHALSFYSKSVKKRFLCPDPGAAKLFLKAIETIDEREHYDVILPIGDAAWYSLVMKGPKDLLAKIPAPPKSSYAIACDKAKTLVFAKSHGIPCPQTVLPHDRASLISRLHPPVVAKPALGRGKAVTLFSLNEARSLRLNRPSSRYVIQERIVGNGYGFFGLCKNGKLITSFMHKRIREVPPSGGPSSAAESTYDSELFQLGSRTLEVLNWHGVAMVEFKQDATTGEFKLIEINPKFWGSLDLALASGINFPFLATQLVLGNDISLPKPYGNLRYCWPIPDDLRHLLSKPTSTLPVLRDWVNPMVKKNIRISDLGPHLSLAYAAGKNVIRPPRYRWILPGELAASGRPRSVLQLAWLRSRGIKAILDLTEKPRDLESSLWKRNGRYLSLPMKDHAPPTLRQIKRALNFIDQEHQNGNRVLVHCLAGLGRTGVVAACYLVKRQRKSARTAMDEVRAWRPGAIEEPQESSVMRYAQSRTRGAT